MEELDGARWHTGRAAASRRSAVRPRSELRAADGVAAPDLVDVETVAVLRRGWLRGILPARRFAVPIEDLEALAIDRYPTLGLMRRAYELGTHVSAYDAAYVALAEALDCKRPTGESTRRALRRARAVMTPSARPRVETPDGAQGARGKP